MNYWDQKVIRDQLDKKLQPLKNFAVSEMPQQGWIKTLREALGLSAFQLAKMVGVERSRISRLEKAEPNGNLKLSSLKKIAQGLNMKFVYGFVPEDSLDSMIRNRARGLALKRLQKLDNTMRLEKQSLSAEEKETALNDMIEKILIDNPKELWD